MKILEKLIKLGAYISSLILICLIALITTEIILRSFFHTSTLIADEYSGYFYLWLVFFGLGYGLNTNSHIKLTLLISKVSKGFKNKIEIIANIISLLIITYALIYSFLFMLDSHDMQMVSENVSETPLYLTQIPVSIGLFLFLLAHIIYIIKKFKYANDDDLQSKEF